MLIDPCKILIGKAQVKFIRVFIHSRIFLLGLHESEDEGNTIPCNIWEY
jgi:hypothetical protein